MQTSFCKIECKTILLRWRQGKFWPGACNWLFFESTGESNTRRCGFELSKRETVVYEMMRGWTFHVIA